MKARPGIHIKLGTVLKYTLLLLFIGWAAFEYFAGNADLVADRMMIGFFCFAGLHYKQRMNLSIPVLAFGIIPLSMYASMLFDRSLFGIPFDLYLHFFSGIAGGLIFTEYYHNCKPDVTHIQKDCASHHCHDPHHTVTQTLEHALHLPLFYSRILNAICFAVCITAGLGSFIEILEYLGYSLGGFGGGLFFYGAGDGSDAWVNSSEDMIANTLGALLGSILFTGNKWFILQIRKSMLQR